MDLTTQNVLDYITNTTSSTVDSAHAQNLPKSVIIEHELNISGLFFLIIPAITILGNFLVIVAVLRFKPLQTAINFLIFGLAVADLLVGLFVMPYAVYVHVQGGYWFLGSLMCDIYSASDVACSTASILLLTVISFDRYRAVTHPLSYSRKSHDTRRVFFIMIVIWVISLALASPIVLGVNIRPSDADLYECRFYNPIFSITSSIISFVIPCFIVLFVYIRIMIALHRRQKIAKARRSPCSKPLKRSTKETTNITSTSDDSGQKVMTGIVEVLDMSELPPADDFNVEKLDLSREKEKKLKNSKKRMQKLSKSYDGAGVYVNRNVNDETETMKIDDIEISEIEQNSSEARKSLSEEFISQLLERLHVNSSPCPCKQAILSRISQNGFKRKESSAIFVPQPEVYKICELQEESGRNAGVSCNDKLMTDNAILDFAEEFTLKDEIDERYARESYLITNINAAEYSKPAAHQKNEQQKLVDEITDKKLLDNGSAIGAIDYDVNIKKSEKEHEESHSVNCQRDDNSKKFLLVSSQNSDKSGSAADRTMQMLKRTWNRRDSVSFRRRANKNQRKEKRATKTLGIVVGIFLICWVPFFSVYILSAVCTKLDVESCQLNFYAFFYTTWLGYINSCANPIIYTIFNVEFRRAFK